MNCAGKTHRQARSLLAIGAVMFLAVLVGCTESDSPPSAEVPTNAGLTYEEELREVLDRFEYITVTSELTPDEFLDNVVEEDVDEVSKLLYPDDGQVGAGQFIPVEEWGEPQERAWDIYLTTRGNLGSLALEPQLLGLYSRHCGD